jgi:hypothetical protein
MPENIDRILPYIRLRATIAARTVCKQHSQHKRDSIQIKKNAPQFELRTDASFSTTEISWMPLDGRCFLEMKCL